MEDIIELQSRIDKVDGFCTALQKQREGIETEIVTLKASCDILYKASIVLKHLLDTLVKDDIEKMAGLVTYGLKAIFDDQDISFVPVVTKKNEKIWIDLKTHSGPVEGEMGSFGGSVSVIESFLLRIVCAMKMNLAKLMFFDETFAYVSEEYIANTSKLIAELSKKLGIDILVVTQDRRPEGLMAYANKVYEVTPSDTGMKMKKLK